MDRNERQHADDIDASPARLQEVEDRLALLERLKRKYGPTLQDVISTGATLARERDLLTRSEEVAGDLDRHLAEARQRYLEVARDLSRRRRSAAKQFAAQVEARIDPPGSVHASRAFQRHLAGVLARRALQIALSRADRRP